MSGLQTGCVHASASVSMCYCTSSHPRSDTLEQKCYAYFRAGELT